MGGNARVVAADERWQELLRALVGQRAAGNDWPLHKAVITLEEHELGVWLHARRSKARRGALDEAKERALDEAVLGWREGRSRGRKSEAVR
jgi:hypothetical protein